MMMEGKKNVRWLVFGLLFMSVILFGIQDTAAAVKLKNPVIENDVSTWDCIWFGNYKQTSLYNAEPLKWRVLNVSGNEALLITNRIISINKYELTDLKSVWWSASYIRTFMNGTMKSSMLTEEESIALKGEIELPSSSMMRNTSYGFPDRYDFSEARKAKRTYYATENWSNYKQDKYWLSDTSGYKASVIDEGGNIINAYYLNSNFFGVRPVVRLDLTKNVWYYAGTVSSDGTEQERSIEESMNEPEPEPAAETETAAGSEESSSKSSEAGNSSFTVGSLIYTIKNEAAVVAGPKNKSAASLTIPAAVRISGKKMNVTAIGKAAFKNMKKLKKVTIGKNVKTIGKSAFQGCSKLSTIVFKTKKLTGSSVGSKAFAKTAAKAAVKIPKSVYAKYMKFLKKKGFGKKVKCVKY